MNCVLALTILYLQAPKAPITMQQIRGGRHSYKHRPCLMLARYYTLLFSNSHNRRLTLNFAVSLAEARS